MKKIGVLGGMSVASTKIYYDLLCQYTCEELGGLNSPDLIIRSLNFADIEKLQSEGVKVCAIEQAEHATMLNIFQPEANTTYALVFGNEVKGVAQNVVSKSDVVIEIPQYGTKHSLNISVSCGVVVWDVFSKLKKPI